ncbi:hypothetical protein AKO1_007835 [Acrasis kona]|uniref:Transmembrane protein n=1 Tax=Acrasis kona TaxID=1008807 RepID=A0AAW2YNK9_9EUKA
MFSLLMFLMFLYYFVRYDQYFADLLKQYSPLTHSESEKIFASVTSKVVNTFNYACSLALCKFVVTWLTFYYSEFQIVYVFSFMSGFLSIVPIISSWVVWAPAAVFCVARDGLWSTSWLVIVLAHLGSIILDSVLYTSFFKGDTEQQPQVLGVSIILGVYAFGWTGVFKGPLSVGLTITLMRIYSEYISIAEKSEEDLRSGKNKTVRHATRQSSIVEQLTARIHEGVNFVGSRLSGVPRSNIYLDTKRRTKSIGGQELLDYFEEEDDLTPRTKKNRRQSMPTSPESK